MVNSLQPRILVDKERVDIEGEGFFRLYLYDTVEGVTYTVLSPIVKKEIKIINERLTNAI